MAKDPTEVEVEVAGDEIVVVPEDVMAKIAALELGCLRRALLDAVEAFAVGPASDTSLPEAILATMANLVVAHRVRAKR